MTLDGTECLALKNSSDGINSTTYLYVSDGWLKELFVRDDTDVSLNAGKNIIEASDFKVAELNNGLYRITITDTEGVTNSRILSKGVTHERTSNKSFRTLSVGDYDWPSCSSLW